MAAQGKHVYVGVGMRLSVLDASTPTALRELGATEFLGGFVEDVALAGSIALVAAGGTGLYVVDIAGPVRPKTLGRYDTPGYAEGVAVAGRYAYVADGPGGLRIIDIADQARPKEVGLVYSKSYIFNVALAGQYAYLAAAGAGLLVADISEPVRPLEVARLDSPGYAYGITVSGDIAYIADGWEGVRVVDVSNPREPKEVASYDTPGWAMYAIVLGSTLYVADAIGGLRVLDVSDGAQPRQLGGYQVLRSHAESLAVSGNTAFVADRNLGLHVVDVSVPARPTRISLYSPMGFADGVAVAGAHAYVAAGRYGLRVVNLSDPGRPREVGALATRLSAATVTVVGSTAYVTTLGHDMSVVDISDPTRPRGVLFMTPYVTPRNQLAVGGALYVAAENFLFVLDISDPLSPCELSSVSLTGGRVPTLADPGASGVAVSGNIGYVAASQGGLLIMDVSDPRKLPVLGVYNEALPGQESKPFFAEDVIVAGKLAYVLARDHVRVLDISAPTSPRTLGFYTLPTGVIGWGPFLAVGGNILYVADGPGGLVAVDVSDPAKPRLAAHLPLPGYASAVAVDGKYLYVAAQDGGLFIIEPRAGSSLGSTTSTAQPMRPISLRRGLLIQAPASGPGSRPLATPGLAVPAEENTLPRLVSIGMARPSSSSSGEAQQVPPSSGNTCTVTSAADSGPGTLRQCLENPRAGETITFDPKAFPPQSPATIKLTAALPPLGRGGITIDGSNAGVILDGSSTPPGSNGLQLRSSGNVVKGLQILQFPGFGVEVGGQNNTVGGDRAKGAGPLGEGNVISGNGRSGLWITGEGSHRLIGNYIGLDVSGKGVLSNGESGVMFNSGNNILGGSAPADRNVISGNRWTEVLVALGWGAASGNVIQGNYIGTDASGKINLSNTGYWTLAIEGGSPNNRVEGNVIVGGKWAGILLFDEGTSYNQVVGNFIGLDASGTVALGNAGVHTNQPFNKIGGTTAKERNIINGFVSIALGATDNVVIGNFLGTDATGIRALGTGAVAVEGKHNFVGGSTKEEGNVVADGQGVRLTAGADFNFVAHNYVGTDVTGTAAFPSTGISVSGAQHNVIYSNLVSGGVSLAQGANFNLLQANRITRGRFGVEIRDAEGNLIVGNSLFNNGSNGYDGGQNNRWDDGKEGNYWSDYQGVDANGDGIGDTPHPVPPNGVDTRPLIAQR